MNNTPTSLVDTPLILGLVGPMGVGKSTLIEILKAQKFTTLELSNAVTKALGEEGILNPSRAQFRQKAKAMRMESHPAILAEKALKEIDTTENIGVSGIRHPAEIDFLRGILSHRVIILGLVASFKERVRRILDRSRLADPMSEDDVISKLIADWKGDTDIPSTEVMLEACDIVISAEGELPEAQDRYHAILEKLIHSESLSDELNMTQEPERFQEIEKRATLTEEQRNLFVAKLEEVGAENLNEGSLTDIYLCPNAVKDFSEIEMDKVGSYSLRIRREVEGKEEKTTVNAKVITNEGDHSAWDEHEISIDSIDSASALFKSIGYKPYFILKKQRWGYRLNNINIFLEKIEDFGWAIEVEIIAPSSLASDMKSKLENFLEQMGITREQYVTKSVTNMMMRKFARF